jgi:ribosome-binding ATPase YchF (GTP1/OBG family)
MRTRAPTLVGWVFVGPRAGGWNEAKSKGTVKMEGKEYVIKDGDVVIFHVSK